MAPATVSSGTPPGHCAMRFAGRIKTRSSGGLGEPETRETQSAEAHPHKRDRTCRPIGGMLVKLRHGQKRQAAQGQNPAEARKIATASAQYRCCAMTNRPANSISAPMIQTSAAFAKKADANAPMSGARTAMMPGTQMHGSWLGLLAWRAWGLPSGLAISKCRGTSRCHHNREWIWHLG